MGAYIKKAVREEYEAAKKASEQKFYREWFGRSVKFNAKALALFNSEEHRKFCEDLKREIKPVRDDMAGRVVGIDAAMLCVTVNWGAEGECSYSIDWLERV